MKKKILEYEKFIERESKRELSKDERERLAKLHAEMLKNFQKYKYTISVSRTPNP